MSAGVTPALVRELAPTGRLRAALNMGNPVLAHSRTRADQPAGVTIDLARELADLLGVPVELQPFDTAAFSGGAVAAGDADIAFLAIDPKRAEGLHFTAAYVEIEGCYAVRSDSPLRDNGDVDCTGQRVVVGLGSAYALFLERHLQQAQLVKVPTSEEVTRALLDDPSIAVAAGVRQQLEADAARLPGLRLLPGRFMVIQQAMATGRSRSEAARAFVERFIDRRRRDGTVARLLREHGINGASVP